MRVESRRTTTAPPQVVFDHLAIPEAWAVWARFPQAKLARPGTGEKYGVGSVRRIWPAVEETVVYEPPEHYAYRMLSRGPARDYRADVHLEPGPDGGTALRWEAGFEAALPGSGPLVRLFFAGMISYLAAGLARHTEHCTAACPAYKRADNAA
jgi:hypothetical protein